MEGRIQLQNCSHPLGVGLYSEPIFSLIRNISAALHPVLQQDWNIILSIIADSSVKILSNVLLNQHTADCECLFKGNLGHIAVVKQAEV